MNVAEEPTLSKLEKKQQQKVVRDFRISRRALSGITRVNFFWIVVILMSVSAIAAYSYFRLVVGSGSSSISEKAIFFTISSVLFMIFVSRFVSNMGISQRFTVERRSHLEQMPSEITPTIRELYISYSCRRCMHYWITFGLIALSIVSLLYSLIAAGIYAGVSKSPKLFENVTWSSLEQVFAFNDWSLRLFWVSIGFVILLIFQYFLFNVKNRRILKALENLYGHEKLVSECMYASRVFKVNSRYKSITFFVVCLFGCVFYIFFKRLICCIFDRSFSLQ